AEKTLRAQFSIGIYHADTADVKLAGQVTAGRETRPGGEIAAFDLHPNMPDQLTIDRLFAIAIQGNIQIDLVHGRLLAPSRLWRIMPTGCCYIIPYSTNLTFRVYPRIPIQNLTFVRCQVDI